MIYNKYIPKLLHICLTDLCQLKCKHCYFGEYERVKELSLEEILFVNNKFFELRDRFLRIGYKYRDSCLNISGGEPMLYSKIEKVVSILPQYYNHTRFLTNGMIFSPSVIKNLLQNSNKLTYQISLDGMKEEHDYIRGKGTFDTIVSNIKKIKDIFPELYIQIAFNVNNKNKECLSKLVPFIKELGVNSIMMDRYVPFNNKGELSILSYEEYKKHNELINNIYDMYNDSSFTVHRYRRLQEDMKYSCGACVENQVCYTNGDRFACTRYHIKTGNWFTDDIQTLLESSIKYYNELLVTPEECKTCIHKRNCNGGMRCLSYSITKQYNTKDIHCFRYEEEK